MAVDKVTASDSTYHYRHSGRTLGRAERIAQQIDVPGTFLDVGCNNGITSQYMLDSGAASHVTGVELHETTVEQRLRERDDFTLLEGNIVDLQFGENYDYIIYGAVHHHILNLFGLSPAIRTLQKLVSYCNKHLFFETGHLGEGGRWEWQQQMRRHFRTDEEHFFYVLRSIEHLIDGFEVIGSFWIHGIRRHFLRIDVSQDKSEASPGPLMPWPSSTDGPFVKSLGSRNQTFEKSPDPDQTDSAAHFWIGGNGDERLFLKKFVHAPVVARLEFGIGSQIDEDWAVQPVAYVAPGDTLAFPWLEGAESILSFGAAPKVVRRRLAAAVDVIFEDAGDQRVELHGKVLLASRGSASLADFVDLNPNNFLVTQGNSVNEVSVVDFEPLSTRYAARNRQHHARILWALRSGRLRAVTLYVGGWFGMMFHLLRYQLAPFEKRVVDRQPSLASVLVSDLRTISGRILAAILRPLGLA